MYLIHTAASSTTPTSCVLSICRLKRCSPNSIFILSLIDLTIDKTTLFTVVLDSKVRVRGDEYLGYRRKEKTSTNYIILHDT